MPGDPPEGTCEIPAWRGWVANGAGVDSRGNVLEWGRTCEIKPSPMIRTTTVTQIARTTITYFILERCI